MDDGPEAVLAALDPEQREVALATRGPVCVIAGATQGLGEAIARGLATGAIVIFDQSVWGAVAGACPLLMPR